MICKFCGYEDNKDFSVCPLCKEVTSLQDQTTPVVRRHQQYDPGVPNYFNKNFGCSFETTQNELTMTSYMDFGDFLPMWCMPLLGGLAGLIFCLIIFIPMFLESIFEKLYIEFDSTPFFIISTFFAIILFLGGVVYLTWGKISVNSNGITVKALFNVKKKFIPKEKIKYLDCRIIKTYNRYHTESEFVYKLVIIMKDSSILNKTDIETGLCYKDEIFVDYLIDKFNEYLKFL